MCGYVKILTEILSRIYSHGQLSNNKFDVNLGVRGYGAAQVFPDSLKPNLVQHNVTVRQPPQKILAGNLAVIFAVESMQTSLDMCKKKVS